MRDGSGHGTCVLNGFPMVVDFDTMAPTSTARALALCFFRVQYVSMSVCSN